MDCFVVNYHNKINKTINNKLKNRCFTPSSFFAFCVIRLTSVKYSQPSQTVAINLSNS